MPGMENGAPSEPTRAADRRRRRASCRNGRRVRLGGNDLIERAFGPDVAGTGVLDTSLAGNGKTTGNRQADAAHLGKVCALAAKHKVHGLVALGDTGALGVGSKTVNPLAIAHDTSPSMRLRARPC